MQALGSFGLIATSRALLFAALALMLSACVTTNVARLGTATAARPVVMPDAVALYRLASHVPRNYEEVALLNSKGDSAFTNEARMFASMKKKAGEVGANAVILDAVSEPGHGAKVAAAIFGVSAQRKGQALAIWVFPAGDPAAMRPTSMPATAPEASPSQAAGNCVSCGKIGKGL